MALRQAVARLAAAEIRRSSGLIASGGLLSSSGAASACYAANALGSLPSVAQTLDVGLGGRTGAWRCFSSDGSPPGESTEAAPKDAEAGGAQDEGAEAAASSDSPDVAASAEEGAPPLTPTKGAVITDANGQRGVMLSEDMFLPMYGGRGKKSGLNEMVGDLDEYLDTIPELPEDIPIYDLPTVIGEEAMVDTEVMDRMLAGMEKNPELLKIYDDEDEDPAPYPGARKILHWRQHGVLLSVYGNEKEHPINKKAECKVHMKELRDELALSDDAVKHIIAVCGPRYTASTGVLRLVSEKYGDREDNRRHIMEQIRGLVEEGRRVFPNPTAEQDLASYRESCRKEAEGLGKKAAAASAQS